MQIWIPDNSIIGPSPPAEQRIKRNRIVRKEAPLRCPGIAPMAWREWEIEQKAAIAMMLKQQSSSGIPSLQDAEWYYKGETTGWLDTTAHALTLTKHADASVDVTSVAGKIGNAIQTQLDVSAHRAYLYRNAGSESYFDFRSTDFTLSAWVWMISTDNGGLLCRGDSGAGNLQWWLYQTASKFRMNVGFSGGNVLASWGSTYSTGQWYFIEAGCNFSARTSFITIDNGTSVVSSAGSGSNNFDTAQYFMLGCNASGTGDSPNACGNAKIDEAGGWKRLWTPTERSSIWNSGNGQSVF